jgi:hypothetical protein
MTIFRSSLLLLATLGWATGSSTHAEATGTQPETEHGRWEVVGSGFGFAAPGEGHAFLFLTCEGSPGWVLITQNEPRRQDRLMNIRVANLQISPPTRSANDGLYGDYTEAMIPSNHAIFNHLAAGQPIQINNVIYPMATPAERHSFSTWLATCEEAR